MKTLYAFLFLLASLTMVQAQNQGGENCGNATPIGVIGGPETCPGGAGFSNQNTDAAEVAVLNPTCDQFGSNYDLWYSFVAPASGAIQLNIDLGTSSRIEAAIWADCGTELFCNSSNSDGWMIDGLVPGTTYLLQLWSDAFTTGTFDFCVFEKPGGPSNDDCDNAININVTTGMDPCAGTTGTIYNNFGATASGIRPFPSCGNFGMGMDVWFSVQVPSTGDLTIEMTQVIGALQDWAFALYSGDCNGLSEIACDDDSGSQLKPKIDLTGLNPGDILYLRVWEIGGDGFGSFEISATQPSTTNPPNDVCAGAIDLTGALSTLSGCTPVCGHNIGATASGEKPPSCGGFGAGRDVWYSVEVPSQGGFNIEMDQFSTAGPQDWGMALYTGTCGGGLTEVACDDDSGPALYPRISVNGLTPGTTVYIRIWEFQGDMEGTFNVCLTPLVPLALEAITLSVQNSEEGNLLSWEAVNSEEIQEVEWMVSTDMVSWTQLHSGDHEQQEFLHVQPQELQYYQVYAHTVDGMVKSNIEAVNSESPFRMIIAPNPVVDRLGIRWSGAPVTGNARALVHDVQGRLISQWTFPLEEGQTYDRNVTDWKEGIYLITIEMNGKEEVTSRIVKQSRR